MLASIATVAFEGVEARRVDVQVQLVGNDGPTIFSIVGLPDKAVAESRERVRGAFAGIGLALPAKRIIANLAPADLPKEGSHFDLPIALALLASLGVVPPDTLEGWAALGELGLDGRIQPVGGTLPAAVAAASMDLGLICPEANGPEAATAAGKVPPTGWMRPSSPSSPRAAQPFRASGGTTPRAASRARAIGRSKWLPSLGRSAGDMLTVMTLGGSARPMAVSAARTRSRLSATALSGRPTMTKRGMPVESWTCTSTPRASSPR